MKNSGIRIIICTIVTVVALTVFNNSHSEDLLPIDPEIGNKGDYQQKLVRAIDAASLEVSSLEWEPWDIIIGRKSTGIIELRIIGMPIYYLIENRKDTIYVRLINKKPTFHNIDWPNKDFQLLIQYDTSYTLFKIDLDGDSTRVKPIKKSYFCNVKSEKKLRKDIILIQCSTDKIKDTQKIIKELKEIAAFDILDPGYYKDFPIEIKKIKKKRSDSYNYTDEGILLAFHIMPSMKSKFNSFIDDYYSEKGIKLKTFTSK